jgi:4'-phosphopantetheinyl transferase
MSTDPRELPLPPPGTVHVYWSDLDDIGVDGELHLDPDEQERASRFLHPRDAARYAAARSLLRRLLGAYVGEKPGRLRIEKGPHGKPRLGGLHGEHPLRFNLSHAGGRAIYAVTSRTELGVDVEVLREVPDALEIAERFFSADEARCLRGFSVGERDQAFLRCWTRKEAFVKALGQGLSHPLDTFSVSLAEEAEVELRFAGGGAVSHRLLSFRPDEQHVAALALEGRVARITRFQSVADALGDERVGCAPAPAGIPA